MRRSCRFVPAVVMTLGLFTFSLPQRANAINPVLITNLYAGFGSFADLALSGDYLYAARYGTSAGSALRIFDVSDPGQPVDVGYNDGKGSASSVAFSGNYAFVVYATNASGGNVGVLDVSDPTRPTPIGQVAGSWMKVVASGHYMYLTPASSGTVSVFDISAAADPLGIGTINGTFRAIAADGGYAYCLGTNFFVYDFSDPSKPVLVPLPGYSGFDVAINGDQAYVAAGANFWIFNISSRTNPVEVFSDTHQPSVTKVRVSGNYAFLPHTDFRSGPPGIEIYDVSNPAQPSSAGFIDGQSAGPITVSCNYVYVSNKDLMNIYSLGVEGPLLRVARVGANGLVLSWPTPTGAFVVQQNGYDRAGWLTITNRPSVVGLQNQVELKAPPIATFYRLVSQ